MNPVFCFGEVLLRLAPYLGGDWINEQAMPVYVGGAELNVAHALARWGMPVAYGTAMPDHYLSKEITASLNAKGIDTNAIVFSGNRIGTYYLPQGADMKNAGVIYDRAHSSFAELKPGQIDWDAALEQKSWLHFSAISPALNEHTAAVCKEAVEAAHSKGLTISVDLNYRAKLWQWGKQPIEVMPELVQYCQVVMGNIWAAEKMLGIGISKSLANSKEAYLQAAKETTQTLVQQFTNCKLAAYTFRFDIGEGVRYYASLHEDQNQYVSTEHFTGSITDKVGSGDCFMAGLIYGHLKKWAPQEVVNFAAAAAFNKLFIKGDATTATEEEIKKGYLHHA